MALTLLESAKIARMDLCLALEPDGGVCEPWRDRFEQSIRLLTESIGDAEQFTMYLKNNNINPLILDKEYCYRPRSR